MCIFQQYQLTQKQDRAAQYSPGGSILFCNLSLKVQSRERFKHESIAEPETVGEYFTLDNTVHFVDAIIVFCQAFFLLFGERCCLGKILIISFC